MRTRSPVESRTIETRAPLAFTALAVVMAPGLGDLDPRVPRRVDRPGRQLDVVVGDRPAREVDHDADEPGVAPDADLGRGEGGRGGGRQHGDEHEGDEQGDGAERLHPRMVALGAANGKGARRYDQVRPPP